MAVLRWKNVKGKPAPMPACAVRRTKLCIRARSGLHLLCTFPSFSDRRRDRHRGLPDRAVTKIVWALSVLCLVTACSAWVPDRGIEAPSGKTGSQLALERPGAHVPPPARAMELGLVVEGFDHVPGQDRHWEKHERLPHVTLLCVCIVLTLIVMRVLPMKVVEESRLHPAAGLAARPRRRRRRRPAPSRAPCARQRASEARAHQYFGGLRRRRPAAHRV